MSNIKDLLAFIARLIILYLNVVFSKTYSQFSQGFYMHNPLCLFDI